MISKPPDFTIWNGWFRIFRIGKTWSQFHLNPWVSEIIAIDAEPNIVIFLVFNESREPIELPVRLPKCSMHA